MKSKRSHEGYLLVDHSAGPGISPDAAVAAGLPVGAARGRAEMPTITCSHCHAVVVMNPLRTRERGYCPKCDHYVCDLCEAARVQSGSCRSMERVIDQVQEAAAKGRPVPQLILP